jgi:hypothetical protein
MTASTGRGSSGVAQAPTRALVLFDLAARGTPLAKDASRRSRLQRAKQSQKHVDAWRTPLSLRWIIWTWLWADHRTHSSRQKVDTAHAARIACRPRMPRSTSTKSYAREFCVSRSALAQAHLVGRRISLRLGQSAGGAGISDSTSPHLLLRLSFDKVCPENTDCGLELSEVVQGWPIPGQPRQIGDRIFSRRSRLSHGHPLLGSALFVRVRAGDGSAIYEDRR